MVQYFGETCWLMDSGLCADESTAPVLVLVGVVVVSEVSVPLPEVDGSLNG